LAKAVGSGSRGAMAKKGVVAALVLAGCGAPDDEMGANLGQVAQGVAVCPDGATTEGIDVSYYQGSPNWEAVAGAGKTFAIARVNHGGFMDPEFETNWQKIREVGLVRGAYQYFDPGGDPVEQANVFVDKVGMLGPGDLPGVIDVESTDGLSPSQIATNVRIWMDIVEEGTGRPPIIYTGSYFWNDNVGTDEFNDHPLWIAHYTTACPNMPNAWSTWAIWQYSSTGSVAGISGNVDLNRYNGDALKLHDFAGNGYRAEIVALGHPSELSPGEEGEVTLVLKNLGVRSWDAATRLGTTMPRDRDSDFHAPSWDDLDRVMAMPHDVAPGEEVTLSFAIVAPAEAGLYTEHFNLVQEAVAWFSDLPPGGGPLDDAIAITIQVGDGMKGAGVGGGASGSGGGAADGGIRASGESSCTMAARPAPDGWAGLWGLSFLGLAAVRRRR
jgi:lysozyme